MRLEREQALKETEREKENVRLQVHSEREALMKELDDEKDKLKKERASTLLSLIALSNSQLKFNIFGQKPQESTKSESVIVSKCRRTSQKWKNWPNWKNN